MSQPATKRARMRKMFKKVRRRAKLKMAKLERQRHAQGLLLASQGAPGAKAMQDKTAENAQLASTQPVEVVGEPISTEEVLENAAGESLSEDEEILASEYAEGLEEEEELHTEGIEGVTETQMPVMAEPGTEQPVQAAPAEQQQEIHEPAENNG